MISWVCELISEQLIDGLLGESKVRLLVVCSATGQCLNARQTYKQSVARHIFDFGIKNIRIRKLTTIESGLNSIFQELAFVFVLVSKKMLSVIRTSLSLLSCFVSFDFVVSICEQTNFSANFFCLSFSRFLHCNANWRIFTISLFQFETIAFLNASLCFDPLLDVLLQLLAFAWADLRFVEINNQKHISAFADNQRHLNATVSRSLLFWVVRFLRN